MSKQTAEVSDKEKERLGELTLLVSTDEVELKKMLLKAQVVQYVKEHYNEIKQNAEKYKLSNAIDLLEGITYGQVLLDTIYVSDDEVPGFDSVNVLGILSARPAFEESRAYTVKQFCREDAREEEAIDECMDSLEYVKLILRVPVKYKFFDGEYPIAIVLIHLY